MASINENGDWQVNMRTLADSAKYLFNNKEMSDVKFVFNENDENGKRKQIYAHSWLLSMMSPVFYESYKSNFEVTKEIPTLDKSHEVFLEFLRFIYMNECTITDENAGEIMLVAKKYSLKFLEGNCLNYISTTVSVNYACKSLNLSISLNLKTLQDQIISFIGPKMKQILQTDSFLNIESNSLAKILQINETDDVTEVEIFEACMKWATQKCITNHMDVNSQNKRLYLGDLVKLIRFPIMTANEIAECISQEDELLSSEEKLSLFVSNATKKTNNFGFVSERRRTDLSFLKDIPEKWFLIYDYNQEWPNSKFNYDEKFNKPSTFTVNKQIYINKIVVTKSLNIENQNVTIEINDDKNLNVFKENFKFITATCFNQIFTLSKPILIIPHKNYVIQLKYKTTNCDFYMVDEKTLPWTKTSNDDDDDDDDDDIEFKFTGLSRLLFGISFKPWE